MKRLIINYSDNGIGFNEDLQQNNLKPSGLSSVEKAINNLKESFGANSNEQFIAICKDLGVI